MSNTRNLVIKIAKLSLLIVIVMAQVSSLSAFALEESAPPEGGTILPGTDKTVKDCKTLMNEVSLLTDDQKKGIFTGSLDVSMEGGGDSLGGYAIGPSELLACGIKTGQIRLWMIPYYIRYILQFVIGIAGLIAVGGIVYGGYLYLFAGISDDKDKGKNAIIYSVAGMVLTLVAWVLVNIVISVVTA